MWIARSGNRQGALRILGKVLLKQEQTLGKDHPDVLDTRGNIAAQLARSGDSAGAVECLNSLLSDQRRLLGEAHPRTIQTEANIQSILSGDSFDDAPGAPDGS